MRHALGSRVLVRMLLETVLHWCTGHNLLCDGRDWGEYEENLVSSTSTISDEVGVYAREVAIVLDPPTYSH